ncbi:MAG: ATP-dependent helicase HrpB [Lentisphaeria bacterium]
MVSWIMLPIYDIRDKFLASIEAGRNVVLSAPAGSGKSTQIPQFLLDSELPGQILVLQPRRLAARMLANRVAEERYQTVGGQIGFQTRFESAYSKQTRVRYITEGILPRLFLAKGNLEGISTVVFDEFHERQLTVDMGLGLCRQLQEQRPDLRLVVMSATLDSETILSWLPNSVGLHTKGRTFPVDISYLPPQARPLWDVTVDAVRDLIGRDEGDILVFMPGAYEIRRTIAALSDAKFGERLSILSLFGDMPAQQQDAVMGPAPYRKIIVATNIAQTSLTVTGVRHVIDSAQARINRYDAGRGLNTLHIESVSQAAGGQRAGRAGREGPGRCIRLCSRKDFETRPEHDTPEISRVDLCEAILQLRCLGHEIDSFPWLDPPPATALKRAREILHLIGATDGSETVELTPLGRDLTRLPAHPRLARVMVEGDRRGCLDEATKVAALLSERPITVDKRGKSEQRQHQRKRGKTDVLQSDVIVLLELLEQAHRADFSVEVCRRNNIHAAAARQVWRTAKHYRDICKRAGFDGDGVSDGNASLARCLLLALPDHLAKRRDHGSLICDLRNGCHGELVRSSVVREASLFVAGDIREVSGQGRTAKTLLSIACEIRSEWLDQLFPDAWEFKDDIVWSETRRAVESRMLIKCLDVVIEDRVDTDVEPQAAADLLATKIPEYRKQLEGWTKDVDAWIRRVQCVAEWFPERGLIQYDDTDMAVVFSEFCSGHRKISTLRKQLMLPFVKNILSYEDQQFIDKMAPARLVLPNGWHMRIKYKPGEAPRGNAKIQDLYDVEETPTVAGGRQKLLLEILGPNMRAVQITDDLAGFWRELYPSVRQELSRRYPKHEWR